MKLTSNSIRLSASDLGNYLGCRHLTFLDLSAALGEREAPKYTDSNLEVLQKRWFKHKEAYIEHLRDQDLSVVELPEVCDREQGFEETRAAMMEGPNAIVQATLLLPEWVGMADVLLRVDAPSKMGNYSYEVVGTKLARHTKGRTILQLCLYSDILTEIQGAMPENMHVVPPGNDFEPDTYRVDDYMAHFRLVRGRLLKAVGDGAWSEGETYPESCDQCYTCRWWKVCNDKRHEDDHLSLVANIRKRQIVELQSREIDTLTSLATLALPLIPAPKSGAPETFERAHHQARVQLKGRTTEQLVYETLPLEEGFGFFRLPEPTAEDIFANFAASQFTGAEGLQYLFGYVSRDLDEQSQHASLWGLTIAEEKASFERFIDEAMARWGRDAGFHIYHYGPDEPTTIKRLMGRHATREEDVDRLLRGERFVNLSAVVRQSLRASVEKYSIGNLEPFFGYQRKMDPREAAQNIQALENALEFNTREFIARSLLDAVKDNNCDNCLSILALRNWLEQLRESEVEAGQAIMRPEHGDGAPSVDLDEVVNRARKLADRLMEGIPADPAERTKAQQAQWILAQLLEWHRREDKAGWWEYFRLIDLAEEELRDERVAISGLEFVERLGPSKRSFIDRYHYPDQETEIRKGNKLKRLDDEVSSFDEAVSFRNVSSFGEVMDIDAVERTIDIKKGPSIESEHATSVFVYTRFDKDVLRDALLRIGAWVADNGMDVDGQYRAGRDLLMRNTPRLRAESIEAVIETSSTELEAALTLTTDLDNGLLPIQGPPGSGKTYMGGRMICNAVRAGLTVGITAVSHKVIGNLLESALEAAREIGMNLRCVQKVSKVPATPLEPMTYTRKNDEIFSLLGSGEAQVAAGTAWLWSREEAAGAVDILFVDEAGQIALADAAAVSQAAKSIVLLGDPQQLEQPTRGSHPDGTDVSALEHLLGEHLAMPTERGLFLATTRRLHPSICAFTSELFYERRLESYAGLDEQRVIGASDYDGAGLWYVPVEHQGNVNSSIEEAAVIAELVSEFTTKGMTWVNQKGEELLIDLDDVLIVAPYNAHVAVILEKLPDGARVGTVDRFQGQEAPVVIYSILNPWSVCREDSPLIQTGC